MNVGGVRRGNEWLRCGCFHPTGMLRPYRTRSSLRLYSTVLEVFSITKVTACGLLTLQEHGL